jgi:hypothetical protein
VITMKNYIVATAVVAGGLLAPFSASAASAQQRRFIDELDIGAYTGTFASSAPIRNHDLHPAVLLKVGSWRADAPHRHASLQPYVISNVRIENISRNAVKDIAIACARSDDELTERRQGDFSIPGVIRAGGSIVLGAIEVDLPDSDGNDKVCRVVSFTPFYPGKPRNEVKEPPPPNVLFIIDSNRRR